MECLARAEQGGIAREQVLILVPEEKQNLAP